MELNFFYAKHKHRMWKMRLKAFLLDLEKLDEQKIVSHNDCELGQWINQYGWEAYKHYPEMEKLVEHHRLIHEITGSIPELKNSGNIKKAREKYELLEKESDHLINLLEQIQEKEKKKEQEESQTH